MARPVDLTGQRFGQLVVLSVSHSKNGVYWRCRCDCGGESVVRASSFRYGSTRSCGCGSRVGLRPPSPVHGRLPRHLYWTWKNMLARCGNPNNDRYTDWGGRGITVCDEWRTYEPFRDWALAQGWRRGLQIDRRDNHLGYSPDNCRITTQEVNANNSRKNVHLTWEGRTLTLAQWAREMGVRPQALQHRVYRGWSVERIFTQPYRQRRGR